MFLFLQIAAASVINIMLIQLIVAKNLLNIFRLNHTLNFHVKVMFSLCEILLQHAVNY